jgi:GcrA cell cycle regulator
MKQQQQETLMRSMNSEFEWTDDRIRKLRQLWSEGHSTAEIGRRMGISKNAVVGKAHRLDLPARPSPIRTGGSPSVPRAPRRQPVPRLADTMPLSCLRGADIPAPVELIVPMVKPARHAAIASPPIGSQPCCWPIGEPGTPAFRFCDDPAPLDVPYCDEHARLAYKPRRQRDTTDDMSPNFNEHEGEPNVRGAAEAAAATRVRCARSRGGPAAPASPLPRPPPGGGRDGSS